MCRPPSSRASPARTRPGAPWPRAPHVVQESERIDASAATQDTEDLVHGVFSVAALAHEGTLLADLEENDGSRLEAEALPDLHGDRDLTLGGYGAFHCQRVGFLTLGVKVESTIPYQRSKDWHFPAVSWVSGWREEGEMGLGLPGVGAVVRVRGRRFAVWTFLFLGGSWGQASLGGDGRGGIT